MKPIKIKLSLSITIVILLFSLTGCGTTTVAVNVENSEELNSAVLGMNALIPIGNCLFKI